MRSLDELHQTSLYKAHQRIKRRHTRRALAKHGIALALVFGSPVAAVVGAVVGSAWGNHVPVSEVVVALLAAM